jgi:hypothetical protein
MGLRRMRQQSVWLGWIIYGWQLCAVEGSVWRGKWSLVGMIRIVHEQAVPEKPWPFTAFLRI